MLVAGEAALGEDLAGLLGGLGFAETALFEAEFEAMVDVELRPRSQLDRAALFALTCTISGRASQGVGAVRQRRRWQSMPPWDGYFGATAASWADCGVLARARCRSSRGKFAGSGHG